MRLQLSGRCASPSVPVYSPLFVFAFRIEFVAPPAVNEDEEDEFSGDEEFQDEQVRSFFWREISNLVVLAHKF